jgi:hypothetical protein
MLQNCLSKASPLLVDGDEVVVIAVDDLAEQSAQFCGACKVQVKVFLEGILSEYEGMHLSQISLSLVIPEDFMVRIDSGQVREAIQNIIDNAIDAMPGGRRNHNQSCPSMVGKTRSSRSKTRVWAWPNKRKIGYFRAFTT